MTASTVDRISTALCLFALGCIALSWLGCSSAQRREARTAIQAIDTACDALEVAQVDGTVTLACELTDGLREEAIALLRPKKKRRPRPCACAVPAPSSSTAPAGSAP